MTPSTPFSAGEVLSVEQIEAFLAKIQWRGWLGGPLWWSYREVEPGIYELLDDKGVVVAWADEEGIHQLKEARDRPRNALPRLFGVGARVYLLPDRLAVVREQGRIVS